MLTYLKRLQESFTHCTNCGNLYLHAETHFGGGKKHNQQITKKHKSDFTYCRGTQHLIGMRAHTAHHTCPYRRCVFRLCAHRTRDSVRRCVIFFSLFCALYRLPPLDIILIFLCQYLCCHYGTPLCARALP